MERAFVSLLTGFIKANGKKILDQPDRFKSLFLDFSQNKYRAEAQVFAQFLASPQAQELKNSADVDAVFLKSIVERFHQTYLFDKNTCEQTVMAYAWFLGLIDKKTFEARLGGSVAGNKPEASVQSPPTPPEPAAEPGRLHTAGQSSPSEKQPRGSPAPRKKKVIWGLGIAAVILVAIFVIIANRNRQEEDPVFSPPYMIRIPGGTFTMGSPENEPGRSDDEGPQRQVTIRSFYIGKYEVTEAEYFYEINFRRLEYPQKPVTNISWYDAIEYCNKLSQREGLTPVYTIDKSRSDPNNQSDSDNVRWIVTWDRNANGYRLPTEAEWEYACRAGTTTAYNLGNSITENVAMFGYFGYGRAIEVGSFAANNWGLHDMHGNASEWCWDWYGAYAKISEIDPVGVSSGLMRVTRGGTAESGLSGVRSASRRAIIPDATGLRFGFRIARNAD